MAVPRSCLCRWARSMASMMQPSSRCTKCSKTCSQAHRWSWGCRTGVTQAVTRGFGWRSFFGNEVAISMMFLGFLIHFQSLHSAIHISIASYRFSCTLGAARSCDPYFSMINFLPPPCPARAWPLMAAWEVARGPWPTALAVWMSTANLQRSSLERVDRCGSIVAIIRQL